MNNDAFGPSQPKQTADIGNVITAKDVLLLNFIKITAVFAAFYILVSYVISFKEGMYIMSIDLSLHLLSIWLINKNYFSYRFSANFYIANCCCVAVLGCSFFSGGLYSPVTTWFALIPIISMLLLGFKRDTYFWLASVSIFLLIYSTMIAFDRAFPINYDIHHYKNFFFASCSIGLVGIIFLIAFLFEDVSIKLCKSDFISTLLYLHILLFRVFFKINSRCFEHWKLSVY